MSVKKLCCETCRFFFGGPEDEPGQCHWGLSMPPVIREMLARMEAEPAARIRHTDLDGKLVEVDRNHCCSGWQS